MARKAELVVFPRGTPVVEQYPSVQRLFKEDPELTTFVRPVDIRKPLLSFASLEAILGKTDRELVRVAEHCEAEVVPHTWGLVPHKTESHYQQSTYRGYSLVAEVDFIQVESNSHISNGMDIDQFKVACRGVTKYSRPWPFNKGQLSDMDQSQFIFGINKNTANMNPCPSLFLVDIEPLLRMRTGIGEM